MTGDRALEKPCGRPSASRPRTSPCGGISPRACSAQGRPELAEAEFREALALAPEDAHLKVGLANAFLQQGKNDLAVVILEDVTKRPDAPALAFVLFARLLFARRRGRGGRPAVSSRDRRRPVRRRPRVRRAAGHPLDRTTAGPSFDDGHGARWSRGASDRPGPIQRRIRESRSTGRISPSPTSAGWSRSRKRSGSRSSIR